MDLSTNYLGLTLKNPLVPSASPLSLNLDNIKLMEDAGASAVVMYSLFEEQINNKSEEVDQLLSNGTESFGEAMSYFPDLNDYNVGPEEYLNHIRTAKKAVDIPIIGSLNGISLGGWTKYAKKIEEAGADALELNIYYIPTDPQMTGVQVEKMYIDIIREVSSSISIPVSVKAGPFFSSIPNMCLNMVNAGAKGLVLFNKFYQPDFDIEEFEVNPKLKLSRSYDMRLPMRWVAIMYDQIPIDFAITSGVHTYKDVIKSILAGASVTMMASVLLSDGIDRIGGMLEEIENWMIEKNYNSISQMKGRMSQGNIGEPAAFERANYMKVLQSWRQDPTGPKIY